MDKKYTLNICGVNIGVISNESEEYIEKLASNTEKAILEVKQSSEYANLEMSCIVAIMSFLEELDELKKSVFEKRIAKNDDLNKIEKYKNDYDEAKVEIDKLRKEIFFLQSGNRNNNEKK